MSGCPIFAGIFVICSAAFEPTLHRFYLDLLRHAGFEPRIVQEVTHLQTQLGLVAASVGVSLVPSSVAYSPRPGVVFRDVSCPQVMLPKSAAWVKGSASPQLSGFLAAARQTAARLHASPLALVASAPLTAVKNVGLGTIYFEFSDGAGVLPADRNAISF